MSDTYGTTTAQAASEEFDHINIMEIDPTYKPVSKAYYNLQVNKVTAKTITPKTGKNAGRAVLVLNGSFTIVNDDTYAGRKIWKSFWTTNPVDLKDLRRLADATGMPQQPGQTLTDYAGTFEALNPPAEFNIFVDEEPDYRNPQEIVNALKFNTAKPSV